MEPTPDSSSVSNASSEAPAAASAMAEQRITFKACFLGLVASIGGFMFGYVSGQISGFFDMEDFARRFGQHDGHGNYTFGAARQGAMVGLLPAGALVGSLVAGHIADSLGRRKAISVSALFSCIGTIIEISSKNHWGQFTGGRAVTGMGMGALSVVVPMYQGESSPAIIRGLLISCYQLFITLGIWTSEMVNYGTHSKTNSASWRITIGISFAWAIILGAGIWALPESPRYDYRNGQEERARETIASLAGVDKNHESVNIQIADIREKLEEERAGADTRWYQIFFRNDRMLYRTILGILLQSGQQLTGVNFFFYYGTTIFRSTGISDSYVTQIILGSVNVVCTFGGLAVVKYCGRRRALITGALVMMMCFLVYSFVGHFALDLENPANSESAGAVLIAFSCIFIAAFATTWGPLVWAVVAELYPAKYRAPAMAFATASNWFWNFMLSFFTRFITDSIDYLYGLVFAFCCAALVVIVYFMVIESKDRGLEEIDTMYLERVNPRQSRSWVMREKERVNIKSSDETGNVKVEERGVMADGLYGAAGEKEEKDQSHSEDEKNHERELAASPDSATVTGDAQLQRGLSGRHLNFIAIGGTIGTGFFLGSGTALSKAGPVGCLISYIFVGTILWSVMVSLGEMATYFPTAGAFSSYATRFVDPSLGFAMGWLYWFSWSITYALSLTAAGLIIQYWDEDFNIGIVIAIFWVVFTLINYLPVRWYGELEMWLSSLKVITIIGFIIFAICVAGGVGDEGVIGFKYWSDPGPFREYVQEGSAGKFVGFWAVLIQASFAYQGAELVGVGAGEARDPRKTVPRAIRTTFWGIMSLFVISIFLMSMIVRSDDPSLLTEASNASASPLVIAAVRAGVKVLPDIINAVLLTAVLSAANSNVYSGSRILVALADEGQAPALFKKTNKWGIPYAAVAVTSAFGLLGFLNLSSGGGEVFTWFLNISGVAGLITWASTCLSFLGFMRAMKAQGVSRDDMPYRSPWQPYTAIYGLVLNIIVALTQGFTCFMPWKVADFFAAYISLFLFIIIYIVHKVVTRSPLANPREVDLVRGRLSYDSDSARED
ncbi:hypothetical protein OQA88_12188 [Cercophora sp. LCS_1]